MISIIDACKPDDECLTITKWSKKTNGFYGNKCKAIELKYTPDESGYDCKVTNEFIAVLKQRPKKKRTSDEVDSKGPPLVYWKDQFDAAEFPVIYPPKSNRPVAYKTPGSADGCVIYSFEKNDKYKGNA